MRWNGYSLNSGIRLPAPLSSRWWSNMGCRRFRQISARLHQLPGGENAVLIFDEVMSGFRITTLAKRRNFADSSRSRRLGKDHHSGGMPVNAYGESVEMMKLVAPLGPMYQAGTLSGNPLAMAAGIATVKHLKDHQKEIYPQLDQLAGKLVDGVAAAAKDGGVPLTVNRVGSMFTWFFTAGPVSNWNSASKSDAKAFGRFFREHARSRRVSPPHRVPGGLRCTAQCIPEEDIRRTMAAAKHVFAPVHGRRSGRGPA